MEINARFDEPVVVRTDQLDWTPSPMAGVDRRMLDRIGEEVARATSIVRYAEGSSFSEHTHSGGEEFIVLDGVFQDEHGDYPAGTYVRNPIGTHHVPRSGPGCTIFVKLWQFQDGDTEQFAVDLGSLETKPLPERPGVRSAVLAARDYEHVSIEDWQPGSEYTLADKGGIEILVLTGEIEHDGEVLGCSDWLRWPAGKSLAVKAGQNGARLWIKRGHLSDLRVPAQ